MCKKSIPLILVFFFFNLQIHGQLCEGSLGDPVVEINFGSGTAVGAPLGADITAFTYAASGELDEGEYTIKNTTSGLKPGTSWHTTSDHTGDTNGYMMVINSAVLADDGVFYTKAITGLCADTTYEFSAWVINIMNPNVATDQYNPNITFRISNTAGTILGAYNTGNIAQTNSGTWVQYGFFFTLNADTEVIITMLNSAPSAQPGNDIALDDIAFKPCGPTITNSIDNVTETHLTVCQNETISYNFQTTISSGYSNPQYQWQYSDDNGITWNDIIGETTLDYIYTDSSTPGKFLYRITAANGNNIDSVSCRITSTELSVEVIETPEVLTGETEQNFCITQNPTLNNIKVSASAIWYDAITDGNLLTDSFSLTDGATYYAAQETNNGCESDDRLAISVTIVSPTLIINNISTDICDDLNDGNEIIDLTTYETDITACEDCLFSYFTLQSDAENYSENGKIASPTNFNWELNTSIIYARIESSDNCHQIAKISINLIETPIIPFSDSIGICEGDDDITIDAGIGFDSYLWTTGETSESITVSTENIGDYSVTVTQDHGTYICSSTKEFTVVLSNIAIIDNIDTKDWTDNNNAITINLSDLSIGDYEYSLDNITYQDSNVFTALNSGEHTVYVRDKNGCGTIEEMVYILNAPKFFTPNSDGYNDTWSIKHSEIVEPTMTIIIYDRYGKLIKFLDTTSSWDGTCHGSNMPTSDYWFVVNRANGSNNVGHFTLKR